MALYAYIRVSTEKQSYDRQLFNLTEYFSRMGINPDGVTVVSEKITSHTRFTARKIYPVLKKAQEGDIVYTCQLDRLGRTMVDILELVDYATKKGVTLLTIDNGYQLENRTAMGKMYLGILSAMAEAERELRAERCQSGVDAAREELEKNGQRIARVSGKIQTHWGNRKGTDETKHIMAIAREYAAERATDSAILWLEQSCAVEFARTERKKGRGIIEIAESLGELYDMHQKKNPDVTNPYATRTGCKPSKGTVSRWCREMNPLAV